FSRPERRWGYSRHPSSGNDAEGEIRSNCSFHYSMRATRKIRLKCLRFSALQGDMWDEKLAPQTNALNTLGQSLEELQALKKVTHRRRRPTIGHLGSGCHNVGLSLPLGWAGGRRHRGRHST